MVLLRKLIEIELIEKLNNFLYIIVLFVWMIKEN